MSQTTPDSACLYRLGTDRAVTPALTELTISNGLAWSPDGTLLHHTDTPTRRIDAYT